MIDTINWKPCSLVEADGKPRTRPWIRYDRTGMLAKRWNASVYEDTKAWIQGSLSGDTLQVRFILDPWQEAPRQKQEWSRACSDWMVVCTLRYVDLSKLSEPRLSQNLDQTTEGVQYPERGETEILY